MYLLCKKLSEDGIAKSDASDLYVVFISNEKKQASNFGNSHSNFLLSSMIFRS